VFEGGFQEIAAILAVAAAAGGVALLLRQPLIVAFIAVGILVGPAVLGWVSPESAIDLLASIGIALLLFVVGLKLDLHLIRSMGKVALATGLGQVLFTSVVGFGIALLLGIALVPAVYVAVALTFSSTIIIVKLLSDKREIDSLHGRVAVGLLIVQDIVVVVVMIVLNAIGRPEAGAGAGQEMLLVLVRGAAFLAVIGLLMKFVLPRLLGALAYSQELLILFAIAWAVALGAVGDVLGFSKEVGAFVAGISIASTPFREVVGARLVGLRDFLLLFFFIDLGARLDLGLLQAQIGPAVVLSLFVLVGNPIIVLAIMGAMGYTKRTGFLTGLTVAQISEFSLLFAALGLSLGHIGRDTMGLITLVGLITIGLSTYLILYSHRIYPLIAPYLGFFEFRRGKFERMEQEERPEGTDVILFGLGRFGGSIAPLFCERGLNVMGVDFDPEVVRVMNSENLPARYGDVDDPELIGTLPLDNARWVVSTLPQRDISLLLLSALRHHGYEGKIALTAHSLEDAEFFRSKGADAVLLPFLDAAKEAVDRLASTAASGA
jgi:Kef-type K+ transport system membrane component KefB